MPSSHQRHGHGPRLPASAPIPGCELSTHRSRSRRHTRPLDPQLSDAPRGVQRLRVARLPSRSNGLNVTSCGLMQLRTKLAFAALWSALALACPDSQTTGPAAKCSKAYEQCTLAQGLLGVCDPVDCSDGQTAPCLVCRPQHWADFSPL